MKKRTSPLSRSASVPREGAGAEVAGSPPNFRAALLGGAVLLAVFGWAYAPSWATLVHAWEVEPDYSHGWLVVPLTVFFLWHRRSSLPQFSGPAWGGLGLIVLALGMKVSGSLFYLDALDSWSMPIWLAGVFWLAGGWAVCRWALPALAFLWFMMPLPYRLETGLSLPMQRIATEVSCWTLQSLGQPAVAEGNVINIGGMDLEVAQACSGLRIFVSVIALAYAYAILVQRPWWIKGLLFVAALPVAVLANSVRVTLTGLLLPQFETEAARHLAHDAAGWVVIPLAAGLLGLALWYLGRLFVPVRMVSTQDLLRTAGA